VVSSDAHDPEKNVPWLLIKARTHVGKDGELSQGHLHSPNKHQGWQGTGQGPAPGRDQSRDRLLSDYYFYGKVK